MTTSADITFGDRRRGDLLELVVVFGLTVLVPLCVQLSRAHFVNFEFDNQRLLRTIAAELFAVVVLWPWLARRGWRFREIAGTPRPIDLWRGFLVAVLAYLACWLSAVLWVVFGHMPEILQGRPSGSAAIWVIALVVLVNPLVEEFLWLGYGFTALERYGIRIAVAGSIVLRLALHLYQGWTALVVVLPAAIVFTVYFAEKRRLWAVIIAHMIVDTFGLMLSLKH